MPQNGVLRTWNDDRGFGFIAPANGGREVFVHLSAFPRDGSRPVPGETLSFDLARGPDGRPRAINVVRTAIGRDAPVRTGAATAPRPRAGGGGTGWLGGVMVGLVVLAVGWYAYSSFEERQKREALERMPATAEPAAEPSGVPGDERRCDGRTHCSQMTSCEEAKWFINHCPGTQMDGNHDGVPCEQQWCTGLLSR